MFYPFSLHTINKAFTRNASYITDHNMQVLLPWRRGTQPEILQQGGDLIGNLCCSRHWFFGANLIVDGESVPETLMSLVKDTLKANPNNSVIGFHDNSSAIR